MNIDILSSFNFIDIIVGLVIIRCVYAGATAGLVVEFFKLVGMFFAAFITLHYFSAVAQLLERLIGLPLNMVELVAFVGIWILVVFIFKVIRDGWMVVIKTEAQEAFNRWGGAITGIFRGLLVASMTILVLFLAGNQYVIRSVNASFSGFYLTDFAPAVYQSCYDDFVGKLFPKEKKNLRAMTIRSAGQKKKDKSI